MQRTNVSSSQIRSIGHDPDTQTLEVEFQNGAVYQYEGVTSGDHASLVSAGSIGSHFNSNIKGSFPYKRVSG